MTSLHNAAKNGNADEVERLLVSTQNVNKRDASGNTALHLALQNYNKPLNVVKHLVNAKADVNAKDKWGITPLHLAVSMGWLEMVTYLLANAANVNIADCNGDTPLHTAARADFNGTCESVDTLKFPYHQIVDCLIENNAKIDEQNKSGCTPFFLACEKGQKRIIFILLKANADYDIKNDAGDYPISKIPLGCGNLKQALIEVQANIKDVQNLQISDME